MWIGTVFSFDTADAEDVSFTCCDDDMRLYKGRDEIRTWIEMVGNFYEPEHTAVDSHGRTFGSVRHILTGLIIDLKGDTSQLFIRPN